MNNLETFILTLLEVSSFMIIFSEFNKNREKLFFKNFIITLFISIFVLLSDIFFTDISDFLNYIVMYILIFLVYKNKHSIYSIILKICLSSIVILIIELFLTTISKLVLLNNIYTFKVGIIINLILIIISLLIYYFVPINKEHKLYKPSQSEYILGLIVLNSIIYTIVIKLIWEYDRNLVLNHVAIFMLFFLLLNIINFLSARKIIKLIEEKKSNEINSIYSRFIENMIYEIKRKQHEFKNHLNAIYGICNITDEKLIKNNIIEYIKSINSSLITIDELINVNNKVLAAVIYSKLCEAKIKDIKFLYLVKTQLDNKNLKNYELVEILSNLLNNAFEYIENNSVSSDKKIVHLNIGQHKNIDFIEVKNYYIPSNTIDIDSIFKKGFSTKGKDRGYGLYNIKKIIENSGGKLQLFFENNYIVFKVIL